MIIQCAQCKAKFRLDDSKVSDAGIKVRCSKCKHIFVVKREAPVEESDLDLLLGGLDSHGAGTAAGDGQQGGGTQDVPASATTDTSQGETSFSFDGEESEEVSPSFAAGPSEVPESGEDFSSFALQSGDSEKPVFAPEEETRQDESFGGFEEERAEAEDGIAFSDSVGVATEFAVSEDGAAQEDEVPAREDEISFGEVSPEAFAAATNVSDSGADGTEEEEISFEFSDDETTGDGEEAGAEPSASSDIDFGEIDFGIEDTEAEPPRSGLFSPAPETADLSAGVELVGDKPSAETMPSVPSPDVSVEDEAPPLSISSRRKGEPFLPTLLIALSVLVIIALAGLGFYYLKAGPEILNRLGVGFVADWFGIESRDEGSISIDKVGGSYLVNPEAGGELFVIRGEAVNNYRKPRAAIQVRGALLGKNGQILAQKVAYCGNNLTDEQIRTLPLERLDAAMGNQFGDSLANLGVQPGKRIPFVIVIANIPKDAADYSVEAVGSTVASQ